ncbi:MAG: pterin-4-alpha-carbinolamine dehydratase [Patescibacteria group bacterium]|jgi:4a-hydroxytetrahydrobiopterin dehydratase|nr:pterin-4-alpha-carbinolamine dehydratase [Patescibacteria group bacterium]
MENALLESRLKTLPGWEVSDQKLVKEFLFADFSEAFEFMTKVAAVAESLGHHPDWSNSYNKVTIELTTHDEGGISEKDLELAEGIEGVLN